MDPSRELSGNASREGVINGIPVPRTAAAEEFPVNGHHERWENFDNAFETPIGGLNRLEIPEDIDPLGLYKPLVRLYVGPPAPEPVVIPQPVVIPVRSPIALRYDAEFRRLELALAEKLHAQAIEEGTDRALQQDISAPGRQMNTAAPAPFIVPRPENVTDVAPTAPIEIPVPKLLVVSALEPTFRRQEPAAVEKVLENVEVIAVHSEHNSSESFIKGSFSSGSSQQ